jgi:hypothetical protein
MRTAARRGRTVYLPPATGHELFAGVVAAMRS